MGWVSFVLFFPTTVAPCLLPRTVVHSFTRFPGRAHLGTGVEPQGLADFGLCLKELPVQRIIPSSGNPGRPSLPLGESWSGSSPSSRSLRQLRTSQMPGSGALW